MVVLPGNKDSAEKGNGPGEPGPLEIVMVLRKASGLKA